MRLSSDRYENMRSVPDPQSLHADMIVSLVWMAKIAIPTGYRTYSLHSSKRVRSIGVRARAVGAAAKIEKKVYFCIY